MQNLDKVFIHKAFFTNIPKNFTQTKFLKKNPIICTSILFSHTQYTNTFNLDSIIKPRIIVHISLFLNISIFWSELCFLSLGLCVTVSVGACVVGNLSRLRLPLPTGNARRPPAVGYSAREIWSFLLCSPAAILEELMLKNTQIFFYRLLNLNSLSPPYIGGI